MKFISAIIVIGLLTVSLLGFAAMSHESAGCDSVISGMTTTDCPQTLMAMAVHHISVYTSFSQVTISYITSVLLSMLLLAIIAGYIFSRGYGIARLNTFYTSYLWFRENVLVITGFKEHHWLSLLQNSPATI